MKRWLTVVAMCPVILVSGVGCSCFVPAQQRVTISASHKEARILVDGKEVGTGSAEVMLNRNEKHTVIAEYQKREGAVAINKKISGTGTADIVGGVFLLVPFIGCASPGFWELDPTDVKVIIPE
ncbi:MAG TPA: hypothetical protein VM008_01845 [Phycisphaerae bacterium]|nr:hypothetical protein [Phycisphaerae bacterium]